jgi:hypothetical protein
MYRTSAFGLAIQPDYLVDGQKVSIRQPNGFVVCELPPGRHQVAVDTSSFNVNILGGSDKAVVDLRAGNTAHLYAQPQPGLTIGILTLK